VIPTCLASRFIIVALFVVSCLLIAIQSLLADLSLAFVETPLAADEPHVASLTTTPARARLDSTLLSTSSRYNLIHSLLSRPHSNSQIVTHQLHTQHRPIAALPLSAIMARSEDVGDGGKCHSDI
jgi:hypothetical protein